jgi:hypothetical protein
VSTLGQEIANKLDMPVADVDAILAEHHVSTAPTASAAARLRLRSLRFSAVKTLTGVHADGTEDADKGYTEDVPVEFMWDFASGLHGVGSEKNFRGKSSVTRILLWALRGRCDLRDDVRQWIRQVEVDFSIDSVDYQLSFDVTDGVPSGSLHRRHGGSWTPQGSFRDEAEFEETMGSVMMSALSLSAIAATQEGKRTAHSWPTYAAALVVRGDSLDLLLGDTKFAGLPSRLLQMFVGSEWASARAEATTAHSVAKAELAELEAVVAAAVKAGSAAYELAEQAVADARARVNALPLPTQGMADVDAALSSLPELDEQVMAASKLATDAKIVYDRIAQQLKLAEFAANAATEDVLARRFFQQLRPTVCPRCSGPVTAARRAQEAQGHSCSVCVSDLDLEAFAHDELTAAGVTADHGHAHGHDTAADDDSADGGDEDVVDDVSALARALEDAATRWADRRAELKALTDRREATAAVISSASGQSQLSQTRRDAEIALARAEGVAQALRPETAPNAPDQADMKRRSIHVRVLDAAEKVAAGWVTTPQRDRLEALSIRITELARSFGMTNLTAVTLDGGARMKVTTGGQDTSYSKCERGEMLRLKVATAIALIEQARSSGVGRHPGLLFVDSPGSEEMDEDDFDTMLGALDAAATASEIQVIVATRHVDSLADLLDAPRLRVARGTSFLW